MKIKGVRWIVIGLIMLVTVINYLDRGTLNYMWVANIDYRLVSETEARNVKGNRAVLEGRQYILTAANGKKNFIEASAVQLKEKEGVTFVTNREGIAIDLGLIDRNDPDASQKAKDLLGWITIFFMIAYGISQLVSGKLYDKIGCRKGFFWSVLVWGTADALASLSRGIFSLTCCRMMLGLGEAGPWPGTTKSNAEWFPQKERAFAQGLFGAAASIGSILAPIIILMLFIAFGWQVTFVVVGALGLIWLIPWLIVNKEGPKKHPWITKEERTYILSGQPEKELKSEDKGKSWGELLRVKKNWSVILGRFFLDPIWWMFVTFLPLYLADVFHLNIKEVAFSAWVPYVGAALGSVAGGWYSGWLIHRGHTVNYARKAAMLLGGLIIVPSILAAILSTSVPVAIFFMALVLGGFQFFITNLQTIPSDLHCGKSVGSLAGLGGTAAVLGTILAILFASYITNWILLFSLLSALVPLSLGAVFLTVGEIKQLDK
ncbi:MAG: MFS transporter [Parabacteroides sp.]|nr:MFS transporter [Parabacteroides sp.]